MAMLFYSSLLVFELLISLLFYLNSDADIISDYMSVGSNSKIEHLLTSRQELNVDLFQLSWIIISEPSH